MQPKKLEVGQGIAWYGCGWNIFKRNASVWVLFGIIFLVINFVMSFIPLLGPLLLALITPLLAAGFLLGAQDVDQGGTLEVGTLFRAFSSESIRTPLLILGAILLGFGILTTAIMAAFIGTSMMAGMGPGAESAGPQVMMQGAGLGFVVFLIVYVLIAMCMFFALPLVTFDGVAPVEAVKTSFRAAITNIVPFLLFLIVYIVLMFIASIPFFLGFILLIPIVFCSVYCAYRGVFK